MFKKTALSLMLSLACFAGINPWIVKTQEDVDALTKHKEVGEKTLAIRQDTAGIEALKTLADAKELVKKHGVTDEHKYMYIANIKEIRRFVVDFLYDADCPFYAKIEYINFIENTDKDKALDFIKENITKTSGIRALTKMLKIYISNLSEINENEAKTTLKKVYLNVYPKIGENENYKPLAVQVKLALDALKE